MIADGWDRWSQQFLRRDVALQSGIDVSRTGHFEFFESFGRREFRDNLLRDFARWLA